MTTVFLLSSFILCIPRALTPLLAIDECVHKEFHSVDLGNGVRTVGLGLALGRW